MSTTLAMVNAAAVAEGWPPKQDLLGVLVSETHYDEAVEAVVAAGLRHQNAVASFFAVHAVVTAARDRALRSLVRQFEVVAPDGQPVRWALNVLYGAGLRENVRGAEFMWRACRRAAEEELPVYLYGGAPHTLDALRHRLMRAFPKLKIAGAESPPFRPLTDDEEEAMVRRINASGAGLVFIGLGCPKQDWFAARHKSRIRAVLVCVGAAFDFHAGEKVMAPRWMQRAGLEWFHRLCHEPRRLWRRYLTTNTLFVFMVTAQAAALIGHTIYRTVRPRFEDTAKPLPSSASRPLQLGD